jgi:hypothetical protein
MERLGLEMITVTLTLVLGQLKAGKFVAWDSVDMEIINFNKEHACENINHILADFTDKGNLNYAELRFHVTGVEHEGFLIGSFRRMKI